MRWSQQDLVEYIKREIIADIQNRRSNPLPFHDPYHQSKAAGHQANPLIYLSDLDPVMINAIKSQVLWEIQADWAALHSNRTGPNGQAGWESWRLVHKNSGWPETLADWSNHGRLKGILTGLGTAALAGLLVPSVGQKLFGVLSRTVDEGRDLLERTRSTVARAREGLEDIFAEASFNHWRNSFMEGMQDRESEPSYPDEHVRNANQPGNIGEEMPADGRNPMEPDHRGILH